jgi:hypothetical protein
MAENNEKMKKAEEHLTNALADVAESEPETARREEARNDRARAEQEMAEARGSKDKDSN